MEIKEETRLSKLQEGYYMVVPEITLLKKEAKDKENNQRIKYAIPEDKNRGYIVACGPYLIDASIRYSLSDFIAYKPRHGFQVVLENDDPREHIIVLKQEDILCKLKEPKTEK